jgi:ribose transport system permease protein
MTAEPATAPKSSDRNGRAAIFMRGLPSWRTAGILLPFLVLFVVLSISSGPFFTKTNLLNILDQQSATLIMAGAGTLVLISGGIDLSVGANYALCGVVAGEILQHHNAGLAIVAAILVGVAAGFLNGVITTFFRINALIATLAMSFILSGLASKVTSGNLLVLGGHHGFADLAQSEFLTVRTSIWIAVVCLVLLAVVLSRTALGRYMYAVGGNAEAARLAGLRTNWVRIAAFTASGAAAAIGGLIDTSRVLSAQSSSGDQLSFTVLAGIVVGGTSILGGEGAIWRTILGVLFISLVGNGFDLLGVDPLYQQITLGVILLLAVGVDAWARANRSVNA